MRGESNNAAQAAYCDLGLAFSKKEDTKSFTTEELVNISKNLRTMLGNGTEDRESKIIKMVSHNGPKIAQLPLSILSVSVFYGNTIAHYLSMFSGYSGLVALKNHKDPKILLLKNENGKSVKEIIDERLVKIEIDLFCKR